MNQHLSRFTLLAAVCLTFLSSGFAQKKLLVLGSSTSACWGPTNPANCYLNRLSYYYNTPLPMLTIENRAAAGFNVYMSMPRNYYPPIGRDSSRPYYSITDAMSVNPDAVLINYPSNNYDIYSVSEVMFCLRTIKEEVNRLGKPCYITTTQPRTSYDAANREKLRILKDSILYQFGAAALDFWSGIADPVTLAIATPYQVAGDPVHLNDSAHNILYQRVLGKNLFNTILPDAGQDQTITLPINSIQLDGSSSNAPGSAIAKYNWAIVSGPAGAMITSSTSKTTSVTGLVQGLYTFRLTITSTSGLVSSDDIIIRVNPGATQPPIANAGKDESIPAGQATVLHGETSTAPSGTIKSYLWTKISGPDQYELLTPAAASSWIRNMVAGTYVFRLTITDSNGLKASDDVTITVTSIVIVKTPTDAPIPQAGPDLTISLPVSGVFIDGSKSTAPGSMITNFIWSYVSGPATYYIHTPIAPSTEIKNLVAGVYTFRLTVRNYEGISAYDDVVITVKPVSQNPPVANAGKDETIPLGQATVLRGENSTAPGGLIKSYLWTKVSGPSSYTIVSANAASTWIKNMVEGTYTYRLTITDTTGATAFDDVVITVLPGSIVYAAAGSDIVLTLPSSTALLDGRKSSTSLGTITAYNWIYVSGPNAFNIINPDSALTKVSGLIQGIYTFRLTVTNSQGSKAFDDILVTVNGNSTAPIYSTVANAGKDEIIPPGQATVLHGEGSIATGAQIVSYAWTKYAGPVNYELLTPNAPTTWVRNMVTGNYVYRLTITDDRGYKSYDDVLITVTPYQTMVNRIGTLNQPALQLQNKPGFHLYPNPTQQHLLINLNQPVTGEGNIYIVNAIGAIVKSIRIVKDHEIYNRVIDLSALKPGTYTIKISINKSTSIGQFIKF